MDMIGNAIGGVLYVTIGAPYMFLFNGISYLFSAFILLVPYFKETPFLGISRYGFDMTALALGGVLGEIFSVRLVMISLILCFSICVVINVCIKNLIIFIEYDSSIDNLESLINT